MTHWAEKRMESSRHQSVHVHMLRYTVKGSLKMQISLALLSFAWLLKTEILPSRRCDAIIEWQDDLDAIP